MKIITILLVTSFLFSLSSCYYECDTSSFPKKTYLLPEEAKHIFAYSGEDTIRFLRNNADTVTYIGDKIDTLFIESIQRTECDGNIIYYEVYETIFNSTINPQIFVKLNYLETDPTYIGLSIIYDSTFSFFLDSKLASEPPNIDSININGKTYFDVYQIQRVNGTQLLYNKEFGILKLTSNTVKLEIL